MALKFYKRGQGYYTRLGTAIGLGVLSIYGCYALYQSLSVLKQQLTPLEQESAGWYARMTNLGPETGTWVQALIPAVLLAILAWLIFKAVNKPKFADFMIATEGEMKKVAWSSKKEIISSTKVVIVTVALMAIILAVVDHAFAWFFSWIGVLKV